MITPGSANALLLADAGYQVQRSVRLRSSASASLTRTPSSASNRQTWTWSGWVKRGGLADTDKVLFDAGTGNAADLRILLTDTNFLYMLSYNGAAYDFEIKTTQVFRDPSAWYHFVVAFDTTQATASNRIKLYVNGAQIIALSASTYPALNFSGYINSTSAHTLGKYAWTAGGYFDGYLTEVNFIDGQALTPSSFGEINPVTGVWAAKKYAGTYGTNGFYLNFSDPSAATAAAIGKDSSGNGNNWTPANVSVTAGVTYDSMLDVPLGAGGAERGNYAVLNPLYVRAGAASITSANLNFTTSGSNFNETAGTAQLPDSGKFYWEVVITGMAFSRAMIGLGLPYVGTNIFTDSTNGVGYYSLDGSIQSAGVIASGATYTLNDVIGVAVNRDAGQVSFYKNNALQATVAFNVSGLVPLFASTGNTVSIGGYFNFGQRPWAYTPPTGFKALHTGNLPDPVIKLPAQYMAASLWTGDQTARTITNTVNGVSFQPDLVWSKSRSFGESHRFNDSVRGGDGSTLYTLFPNETSAENTGTALTGFVANGFTMAAGSLSPNVTGRTYVGWQWKANGAAVSNTAGSITSQVSAGVSQGFSVVTYTGTGANATVGHGLGVAPKMIIVKNRTAVTGWPTYHTGQSATPANNFLMLNETAATGVLSTIWNNTAPTSTVFSIGTSALVNGAYSFVAYCFSEVAGFSKFGSYTGNGSADGPFVFCGFRPRFVMVKRTDVANSWGIIDTARDSANTASRYLQAESSTAELSDNAFDILSNGFKCRLSGALTNASGGTYIFMAFAENPFKNSLAR